MLKLENICKTYHMKEKEVKVLDNLTYEFKENQVYCIIGKSGAGKTTLIEIMGLLLSFDAGNIIIGEKSVKDLSDNELADLRNKEIGFVFQSFYLNPLMKAYENVMLPMYLDKSLTKEARIKKSYELLELVGLRKRANHFPKELSGGEQQRVAISRSLANDPHIILADEPTGNLDPENTLKILDILKSLSKKGKCVIIVSHDEVVKKYADIVLRIENNSIEEVHE